VIDDWFGSVNEVRIRVGSIELINIKHCSGVRLSWKIYFQKFFFKIRKIKAIN